MRLILFSKPGCHLCEGLETKLSQVQTVDFVLEVRDITTRDDWFQAYQYEIPVLWLERSPSQPPVQLPRLSPRASVQQLEAMLQKYMDAQTR